MYELPTLQSYLQDPGNAQGKKRVRRKKAAVQELRAEVHDKRSLIGGKRPPKTVGSGGKARHQPQGRQRKFTVIGNAVIPIHSSDYIGYDKRTTLGPEEIADIKVNGYYAKEWQAKRAK
jgi:hypothetical protein